MNQKHTNKIIISLIHSYESEIQELKDKHQVEINLKNDEINRCKEEILFLRQVTLNLSNKNTTITSSNTNNIGVGKLKAMSSEPHKTKYDQSQANIGVNVDQAQDGSQITGIGIQHNYTPEQKQSLAEAAAEIQALLKQLEETYSTNTTLGKVAIAEETIQRIDNDPKLAQRILSALQAGSVSAIEQLLNHPAASFVIGALDDWQQNKNN